MALTSPSLYVTHERSSGPSHHRRFCCPVGSIGTYGRLRRPPGSRSTSRLNTGYRTRYFRQHQHRRRPGRGGPPQFPPPPSERSAPSTPGSSSGLQSRLFTPSVAFAVKDAARLSLPPTPTGRAAITTRQASLDATDRSVAPPTGLLTLGFDPTRFQTRPPTCYRASWQLPGRDSHPQATTSLCWNSYSISNLQTLGALSLAL